MFDYQFLVVIFNSNGYQILQLNASCFNIFNMCNSGLCLVESNTVQVISEK